MKRITLLLSTGLGLGLSPVASGTTGTLLGVIPAILMAPLEWYWQVPVALALAALAIPICDGAEKIYGTKDDGRIVADEYLTFPICTIGLNICGAPWLLAVVFVLCRILDIWKPFPARQLQDLHGGIGIVADDFVSNLYTLGLMHAGIAVWG
jgi:phosphatidylglycerophosphatase A